MADDLFALCFGKPELLGLGPPLDRTSATSFFIVINVRLTNIAKKEPLFKRLFSNDVKFVTSVHDYAVKVLVEE